MALKNQGTLNGGLDNASKAPSPGVRYGRFIRDVVGFGGGSSMLAKWGMGSKKDSTKAAAAVKKLGNPTGLGNPPH
jgi:hypothetical protein